MARQLIETPPVSTRSTLSVRDTDIINGLVKSVSNAISVEEYGAGLTSDDSSAFSDAIAAASSAGVPLLAYSDEYNIDPTTLGDITSSVEIRFGKNTIINNLQTSGTKLATFRFVGTGLTGSAATVTALESAALKDTITVDDTTGFAVGDVCRLSENAAAQTETQYNGSAVTQDFNYREYVTIDSISSNDITFEEFL